MSRHSGFVNLYSHCPKMILLIILHNDSADIIPRSVFANIVPGKNEKCAREIMLNMISVHRDVSVKVLNSYYFTINFI